MLVVAEQGKGKDVLFYAVNLWPHQARFTTFHEIKYFYVAHRWHKSKIRQGKRHSVFSLSASFSLVAWSGFEPAPSGYEHIRFLAGRVKRGSVRGVCGCLLRLLDAL